MRLCGPGLLWRSYREARKASTLCWHETSLCCSARFASAFGAFRTCGQLLPSCFLSQVSGRYRQSILRIDVRCVARSSPSSPKENRNRLVAFHRALGRARDSTRTGVGGMSMTLHISRVRGLAAALLIVPLFPSLAAAQLAVSANDAKAALVNGLNPCPPNPADA